MASFKVPCPSCEHQVPIKNESLIGTKVECPKCKYRFKVEAPAGGVPKDGEKADKKDEKAADKKKKDGGKKKPASKKTVAIIVGGLAVVVLAVVGFAMMGGDDKKKTPTNPNPVAQNPNTGNTNTGTGDGTDDGTGGEKKDGKDDGKKDGKKEKKVRPPASPSDKEATNLLPNGTVALARFDVDQVRQTPASYFFDRATQDMFRGSFGIDLDQVGTYYHAFVGAAHDPFGVIVLKNPVYEKDVASRMAPASKPTQIKKWNLYTFKSNPFVNAVSNALAFNSLFGELFQGHPAPAKAGKPRSIGLCVYDSQHLLIGDSGLLTAYLNGLDAKGLPKGLSSTKGPSEGVALADNPLYLSIDPKLKRAFKDLGGETAAPPPVLYAEKVAPGQYNLKLLKPELQPVTAALDPVLSRAAYLSAALESFDTTQLVATVRVVMESSSAAFEAVKDDLTPALALGAWGTGEFLATHVEFRNLTGTGGAGTGTLPPGAVGGEMGLPGPGGPPRPGMGVPPGLGGSAGGPPGLGGQPYPGTSGSAGGPPGGGKPGFQGVPPGVPPGMGGIMGEGGEGGFQPTEQERPQVPPSHIDLGLTDQTITLTVELNWSTETYRTKIEPRMLGFANTLKGKIAVYTSDLSYHALTSAVQRRVAATGDFPRGTANRKLSDASRMGLRHPPYTRVSFFAELLPYLGRENLERGINRDLAWFEGNNLQAAEAWVPELLVATYPQSAWRATSPFVPDGRVLGGTNYVAVAGVGINAARLDPMSKDTAKFMGITGYEWGSKVTEVTDGLEHTIYLLQTPPGLQQPWLAGGGATVRGLDQANPMQGFSHTYNTPGGKPGTFALMANGDVRFIPGDIKPDLLLAMATRAGGENFVASRIDKEAPLVHSVKRAKEEAAKAEAEDAEPVTPEPKGSEPKAPAGAAGTREVAPMPREKK